MAGPNGSESAEQIVNVIFQGVDIALKLSGSATKNLAQMIIVANQNGKFKIRRGEVRNIVKLLKEEKPLQTYQIKIEDLKAFKKKAKDYGILYTAIKDVRSEDGLCDIVLKQDDVPRLNSLLLSMGLIGAVPTPDAVENVKKNDVQLKNDLVSTKENLIPNIIEDTEKAKIAFTGINNGDKTKFTVENWKMFLAMQSLHYSYSDKNQQLIIDQKPDSTIVMSKTRWLELGRFPDKNANGIEIIRPEMVDGKRTGKFTTATVYDISGTYGREINRSEFSYNLVEGSDGIKNEIERLKSISHVPIEYGNNSNKMGIYNSDSKTISLKDGLSDVETYQVLTGELVHANAHKKMGDKYFRENNKLIADSTTFAMMSKYGMDTSSIKFDYIPDAVNGLDGKKLDELVGDVKKNIGTNIKASEKNLSKFKEKQKPSIQGKLEKHQESVNVPEIKIDVPKKVR